MIYWRALTSLHKKIKKFVMKIFSTRPFLFIFWLCQWSHCFYFFHEEIKYLKSNQHNNKNNHWFYMDTSTFCYFLTEYLSPHVSWIIVCFFISVSESFSYLFQNVSQFLIVTIVYMFLCVSLLDCLGWKGFILYLVFLTYLSNIQFVSHSLWLLIIS